MKIFKTIFLMIISFTFIQCSDSDFIPEVDENLVGSWEIVDNCADKNSIGEGMVFNSDGSMLYIIYNDLDNKWNEEDTGYQFSFAYVNKWRISNGGSGSYFINNECLTWNNNISGYVFYLVKMNYNTTKSFHKNKKLNSLNYLKMIGN